MSNRIFGYVQRRKVGSASKKSVLLFFASFASDDGTGIWVSKARIADELEISRRTVQRVCEELCAAGLLSEVGQRKCKNGFTIEYSIDLHALKRLPLAGDILSPLDEETTGDTMTRVSPCHVTRDTLSPQDVTPCHPNPIGTVKEPPSPPLNAPRADLLGEPVDEPPPRKRAVALPDGWVPSAKNVEDARKANFSDEEIRNEAGHFRDHHHARGTTFKNWDAAWRTWLRNARKFGGSAPRRPSGSRAHENLMSGFARALDQFDGGS